MQDESSDLAEMAAELLAGTHRGVTELACVVHADNDGPAIAALRALAGRGSDHELLKLYYGETYSDGARDSESHLRQGNDHS